jgi:hypothetical protein
MKNALIGIRQNQQKMTRLAEEKSVLATEKTKLADNLAKLGDENGNRIVRLDIANGVRLFDESDAAGALLWFPASILFPRPLVCSIDLWPFHFPESVFANHSGQPWPNTAAVLG